VGFLASLGALASACDSFPENAAVTIIDSRPVVLFRPCSATEVVTRVTLLQKLGSGRSDDDFTQVWEGVPRNGEGRGAIWPLGVSDPVYVSTDGPDVRFPLGSTWRVYLQTSRETILDGFTVGELAEGSVRRLGRSSTVEEFLKREDVC
jgi:hypothetical protein